MTADTQPEFTVAAEDDGGWSDAVLTDYLKDPNPPTQGSHEDETPIGFWPCVTNLHRDAEARARAWRRTRDHAVAVSIYVKWLHYRWRPGYLIVSRGFLAWFAVVWFIWGGMLGPLGGLAAALFWTAAVWASLAPLAWRKKAIWRRQCMAAEVVMVEQYRARIETAAHRGGSLMSAVMQEVPGYTVMHTPRIFNFEDTPCGFIADLEMRYGQTVHLVNLRSDRIASRWGYRIVVEPNHHDPGRGKLRVIYRDPLYGPGIPHPGLDGITNWWHGCPVGVNEDGDEEAPHLASMSLGIFGLPGSGKSVTETNIALHAALDPRALLFFVDGGDADLVPFKEPIAASGGTVIGQEGGHKRNGMYVGHDPLDAIKVMECVLEMMDARKAALAHLPLKKFRRKVGQTDARPIVFLMDEWASVRARLAQGLVAEFDRLLLRILTEHRKCGVTAILTTQDPRWDVVPVAIRNMLALRIVHRAPSDGASDAALGDGWSEQGFSARRIAQDQPGTAWVTFKGGQPYPMRSYWVDDERLVAAVRLAAQQRTVYGGGTYDPRSPLTLTDIAEIVKAEAAGEVSPKGEGRVRWGLRSVVEGVKGGQGVGVDSVDGSVNGSGGGGSRNGSKGGRSGGAGSNGSGGSGGNGGSGRGGPRVNGRKPSGRRRGDGGMGSV